MSISAIKRATKIMDICFGFMNNRTNKINHSLNGIPIVISSEAVLAFIRKNERSIDVNALIPNS